MGVDVYSKYRNSKIDKSEFQFPHGIGHLIQNALYTSKPIISDLEKVLNVNLDFLFELNYYDYQPDYIQLRELSENDKQIRLKKLKEQSEKCWTDINSFLKEIQKLKNRIIENPYFYKEIDYNRAYWLNYLDNGSFEKELEMLANQLNKALEEGYIEITLGMG